MRKRIAALAAVLMAALMCACSLVSVNEEKDMARIAAKVGDIEITKGDVNDYYEQYLPYSSWLGVDTSTQSGRQSLVDLVLDDLLYSKVVKHMATQKGFYNFTDEQRTEIETNIDEAFNDFMDEAMAMAQDEYLEDPDIDVEARAKELLKEVTLMDIGEEYDEEGLMAFLREYFEDMTASSALTQSVNDGVSITEEEVRAAYDETLATVKAELTQTPADYQTLQEEAEMYEDEVPTLYAPEGYIRVRVIAVSPEDEVDDQYAAKKQEINDLTIELGNLMLKEQDDAALSRIEEIKAEVVKLEEEAEKLFETFLSPSKTKAGEAYAKLQGGADFTQTMLEYGADTYFANYEIFREKGRLMGGYEGEWPEAARNAAMKLTTPGSYTEVIESTQDGAYGYYIVQYLGKEPAGERPYADVHDAMLEQTLAAKQSSEWEALVSEWLADTSLITRYEDVIMSIAE